jgi:hypothetical protein
MSQTISLDSEEGWLTLAKQLKERGQRGFSNLTTKKFTVYALDWHTVKFDLKEENLNGAGQA